MTQELPIPFATATTPVVLLPIEISTCLFLLTVLNSICVFMWYKNPDTPFLPLGFIGISLEIFYSLWLIGVPDFFAFCGMIFFWLLTCATLYVKQNWN